MKSVGVSRLLFGEHDSFTGMDVDTCVLHNFALFVQRFCESVDTRSSYFAPVLQQNLHWLSVHLVLLSSVHVDFAVANCDNHLFVDYNWNTADN